MALYSFSGTDLNEPDSYTLHNADGSVALDEHGNPIHPDAVPGGGDIVRGGVADMSGTVTFDEYFGSLSATLTSGSLTANVVHDLFADGGSIISNTVTDGVGAGHGGSVDANLMHGAGSYFGATVKAKRIDNKGGVGAGDGGVINVGDLVNVLDNTVNAENSLLQITKGGVVTAARVFSTKNSGMFNDIVGGTLSVGDYDMGSAAGLTSTLSIREGGKVIIGNAIALGLRTNDRSGLFLGGDGSTLTYGGALLIVGDKGFASVGIDEGAAVNWGALIVGKTNTAGNAGVINVGEDSTMHISSLTLGDAGGASLTVGGEVDVASNLIVANQASSFGGVQVRGGTLAVHGLVKYGNAGQGNNGTPGINGAFDGGRITIDGMLSLGVMPGSYARMWISDADSTLTVKSSTLIVGDAGDADLRIQAGGQLSSTANDIVIARQSKSRSELVITGANLSTSQVELGTAVTAHSVIVGHHGDGELEVSFTAKLTVSGQIKVGGISGYLHDWGGWVRALGPITLGEEAKTIGSLSVSSATNGRTGFSYDALFQYGGTIKIGTHGDGSLSVASYDDGHTAKVLPLSGGGNIIVGKFGHGSISVNGQGSELRATTIILGGAVPDSSEPDNGECGDWTYTGGDGQLSIFGKGYAAIAQSLELQGNGLLHHHISIGTGGSLEIGGRTGRHNDELRVDDGGTLKGHGLISVGQFTDGFYDGTILNNGVIEAKEGTLVLQGNVSGSGETRIDDKATLVIDGDFDGTITFNGQHDTTVKLEKPDPHDFTGTLASLSPGNTISLDVADLPDVIAHTRIRGEVLDIVFGNGPAWHYDLDGGYSDGCFTIKDTGDDGKGNPTGLDLTFQHVGTVRTGLNGAPIGNPYIDSLLWGWGAWSRGTVITYAFGGNDQVNSAVHSHGESQFLLCDQKVGDWDGPHKTAFRDALKLYSSVSGLRFDEVGSVTKANIVWWLNPDLDKANALGSSEVPAQMPDGHAFQYFDNNETSWTYIQMGGDGLNTIIHELGHTLGLAHPHDGGYEPDSNTFPGVPSGKSTVRGTNGQNQAVYTVMSYIQGWNGDGLSYPTEKFGTQGGLGAFDIKALQYLYGVNNSFHTGDNVYTLPSLNQVGTGWSCIWDTAGVDTISAKDAKVSAVIDLQSAPLVGLHAGGYLSHVAGILGGFTIANGVRIENAEGGSGKDKLFGNSLKNKLAGYDGNDLLRGGNGGDTLLGNAGNDKLFGERGNDTLDGGAGNDSLTGGLEKDQFAFTAALNAISNVDTVADFSPADDAILLSHVVFAELGSSVSTADLSIGKTAADANDHLIYNLLNGQLFYDHDGKGGDGQVLFAILSNTPALSTNDFAIF